MSDPLLAEILSAVNSMRGEVNAVRGDLRDHMADEENELVEIRENAQRNREESEKRHTALIQSITSYMDKIENRQVILEAAFVKNEEGGIDVAGHHSDHFMRREFARWLRDIKTDVVKGVAKAATIGALGWVLYALWAAFLQGPHK